MSQRERLSVHLVAEQRLRMQRGRYVDAGKVIVSALEADIFGAEVGADVAQEKRERRRAPS